MNNCKNCEHERVCKAWKREIDSAEECYSGQDYVTIYDRFIIDGDGCELFKEETNE